MPSPAASARNPNITRYLPLTLSESRPTNGATIPDSSDIGAVSSPALVGLSMSTSWM